MKEIKIVCVGKIKEKYFSDGIDYYLKIISKKCPVLLLECADEPTPDKASPAEERKIRETEGERILQKINREDYVIALSINGKHYDTASWQKRMSLLAEKTADNLVFVIGGSLGLSESVLKRAEEELSFSAMTFPHQMMRLILLEQLARSI